MLKALDIRSGYGKSEVLHGVSVDGRTIVVNLARPREATRSAGGYGAEGFRASQRTDVGYGNGGYGGGRVPATDENGIDLRRFLPGGDKDPKRRGIAGLDLNSAQINGKFVNIWNRISDRMQEKCRLGELIGCD